MVEPKFIYSCDHNLIDTSRKTKTFEVVKNRSSEFVSITDLVTVPGTVSEIIKIYSPNLSKNASPVSIQGSSIGTFYSEGKDYEIVNRLGRTFEIKWISDSKPEDGSCYYVSVTYDPVCDLIYEPREIKFAHTGIEDIIENSEFDTYITYIQSKSNRFMLNRDFKYGLSFGKMSSGEYGYILRIYWLKDFPMQEMTLVGYHENTTYRNNYSDSSVIVDNENENIEITMTKQNSDRICPRCNGTGWYVGIFEKNCHRAKKNNLLIQEFVRLLYVTASDDGKYLLTIPGKTVAKGEESVRALIQNIVSNSVTEYNKMIVEAEESGKNISNSEKIYSAGVSNIILYDDLSGAEAKITIVSLNGNTETITIDT